MPKFISDVVMAINKNLNKNQRKREKSVSKSIFPSNSFHLFLRDMYSNGFFDCCFMQRYFYFLFTFIKIKVHPLSNLSEGKSLSSLVALN